MQFTETEGSLPSNPNSLSARQRSILTLLIDAPSYSAQAATDFDNPDDLIDHYIRSGWQSGCDLSPTFRSLRYSNVTPAQRQAGRNPFFHYLFDIVGEDALAQALAGLEPAEIGELRAHFDADWYLRINGDVEIAAHDPFVHYLALGWRELRDPSPSFSTGSYLNLYPDIRNAGIHPFRHWVFYGIAEGRSSGATSSSTLDSWESLSAHQKAILVQMFSIKSYQSSAADHGLALAKRVASGAPDTENATPSYNASRYLASHPEIGGTGQIPFLHYLFAVVGEDVLRDLFVARPAAVVHAICEHFDHAWYLYSYPDVEASGHDALIHYMTIGWKEGRDPSQEFSTRIYLLRYPDIVEAGVNPFLHWVGFGEAEGRSGASSASNFRNRQYAPSVTALLINSDTRPLTSESIAAVLHQNYDKLVVIVAGTPLSDACRAALETGAPGAAGKVVRYLPNHGDASWVSALKDAVGRTSDDLLWIVQGDATHDSQFLARLTSSFADGSVQLGFGRRLEPTDADYAVGEDVLAQRMEKWTRHPTIPAAIWFPEQLRSDLLAAEQYSVLWRRRRLDAKVWRSAAEYQRLGLWHLYLHMASGGQIVLVRDALMRVPATATASDWTSERYRLDLKRLTSEVETFWGVRDGAADIVPPPKRSKRHVLIVTHGIFAGGAENLPIQMANALAQRGIVVSMLIFKIDVNPEMRATLDPGVSIYEADWVMEYGCEKFLRDIGCSLIHSHGVIGEMFFFRLCEEALPVPYVATLHGSYEASSSKELPERFIAKIVRNVDLFVYTADKNLAPLLRNDVRPQQLVKMINAMPVDAAPFPRSRAELGIDEDAIVFTLVARGIPAKGWSTAVNAFEAIRQRHPDRPMHLCLVGEGDEPERLKPLYPGDASISFLGFQLHIHGLYRMTDVAIVPTRFTGESFPLCIIQALQVGVPVIATDVGEIASMLMVDGVVGGITVEHSESDEQFDARFIDAMDRLVDGARRKRLAAGAAELGLRYDMGRFTDQYMALYENVIHGFATSRGAALAAKRNAVAA